MEENMTRTDDAHEIVRYLHDGDPERKFPCVVSHEDAGGPCQRPAATMVYGLAFCEVHGEECAAGAHEDLHQDAHNFFERFDGPHVVPMPNPWVRRALREWRHTVPDGELAHEEQLEALLGRAFPFREELVDGESAGLLADPIRDRRHPVDFWRDHRQEIHAVMRVAHERGMVWLLESLEGERESIAAQCAYALALSRGEHREVLERAHQENVESARKVGELLGKQRCTRRGRGILRGVPALRFAPLLKPAPEQQVQPPNDCQNAYYREHRVHPEEHR